MKKYSLWALICLLGACAAQPISHENFSKIKTGMSERRVSQLLGEPTDVVSIGFGILAGSNASWESDEATITIQFVNGRVRGKQFSR